MWSRTRSNWIPVEILANAIGRGAKKISMPSRLTCDRGATQKRRCSSQIQYPESE